MDFLSIRKKARERAEAKEAAQPGAAPAEAPAPPPSREPSGALAPAPPAAPPAAAGAVHEPAPDAPPTRHVRRPDPVLTETELRDGALQERFKGLSPASDARFATWRPGSGPPPIEPDHRGWDQQPEPRRLPAQEVMDPDHGLELELEPMGRAHPGLAPIPSELPPPEPSRASARPPAPADPLDLFFYRPDEEASVVPSLGGGPLEESAFQPPESLDEYLTFHLGSEEYAVTIERVREVLRAPAITEVPRAPANVLGVVTVRGEVVAVVDARGRLGLVGGGANTPRIVIVDSGEGPLGLLVDAVTNVVRIPSGSIEPCPQGISAGAADCVTGIGRFRDRLFMVIDVESILPRSNPAER